MKTSFTKLFKERWRALIPLLFFCTMSFMAKADPCDGKGKLDSIAEISLTIDCDGNLTVSALETSEYVFGIPSANSEIIHFYKTSSELTHFTVNYLPGATFTVSEVCPQGGESIFYGILPTWGNGVGAGTYTYSGLGKSLATAGTPNPVTNVPNKVRPKVSYKVTKPSCPTASDGKIELTLDFTPNKGCNPPIPVLASTGSLSAGVFDANGKATITGLMGGQNVNITFGPNMVDVDPSDCLCGVLAPAEINVLVPTPSDQTASIACIDRINVSSSIDPYHCNVTVSIEDVMLGVNDPCNGGISDSEYIIVKDKTTNKPISGTYYTDNTLTTTSTGSGYAFTFEADAFFGKEVIVEVHDAQSGNYCWGTALIEDKAPPVISCTDPALSQIRCIDFTGDMAESLRGRAMDCSDVDVTIVRNKTIPECEGSVIKQVELIYFATDAYGNESDQCMDTIQITRIGQRVSEVKTEPGYKELTFVPGVKLIIPEDREQAWGRALACKEFIDQDNDGAPDPVSGEGGAGYPELEYTNTDGHVVRSPLPALNFKHYSSSMNQAKDDALSYCKIGANYNDILIGSYDCVTKYMRTWSVYEWSCEGELDTSWQQIIEIVDTIAPSFAGHQVADAIVSVNTYNCSKEKVIKMPEAWDNCTSAEEIEFQAVVYDSTWKVIGPDIKDGYSFDFPLGRNYVVYTAFDACHNTALDTAIVDVIDKTAPVTVCKEFLVVGISADGTVRVPSTAFDNGSYDDCGLETTCVVRMDDLDAFDALDTDSDGWVLLSSLDDMACGRDFSDYATERGEGKNIAYYLHRDDLCQKNIWFCCTDDDDADEQPTSNEDVMVVFRAIDHYGNSNECMVFVDIQDKTRPAITCPPDVTVDCDLPLPSIDDAILGEFVNISADPLTAYFGTISAEHYGEAFGVHPDHVLSGNIENLVDGTYYDNCEAPAIFVKIELSFDQCNTGIITRTFYAQDGSGNKSQECTQTIKVESTIPFSFDNIKWPEAEVELDGCRNPDDISTEMYGVPEAAEGACMLFGTSYDDQVFRFNNTDGEGQACFKLVRTWSAIDWCSSTTYGKVHSEEFTQIVKVYDLDGPALLCAAQETTETTDCDGAIVELTASASDECTPADEMYWQAKIDLGNDGSYDYKFEDLEGEIELGVDGDESVAAISKKFPLGTHKILWVAEDRCGNRETCESLFTVTLTKAPTPFAVDVSTVLMSTGMVAIWADDINNKSEGPCGVEGVEVAIARNPSDFSDASTSLTFDCDDVNTDGESEVAVDFYAYIDLGGGNVIYDYTTVYVDIQNHNANVCGGDTSIVTNAFIAGNIRTEGSDNVPDVEVGLLGGNQAASALDATVTDTKGQYAFPAMPMGGEYVIDPVSATDYLNGVTTLDLVLIQRYVLGLADLSSAYKIIAADINKDNNISAIDLVDLRSVILGIRDEFVNNESWRFVDATYEFADATNPLAETFSESYTISDLASDMTVDFVGVKVGDVNGSADAASTLAQSRSKFNVSVADQNFNSGDIIQVPLKVSSAIELLGFQFTTSFSSKLQFAGIDAAGVDFAPENLGTNQLAEGILTASWNDVKGTNLAGDEAIITLNFKAIASGTLSESFSINSDVTTAEIYNTNLETMNISLNFTKETTALASGFELGQNTPNPFAENTMISFTLPTAANATVTVFDVTGKVLKLTKGSFDKGLNTIEISKNELASSGVLYYTLETDGFTDTKRMVVLK